MKFRTPEALVAVAVALVLLGTLVLVAILMQRGGTGSVTSIPAALANQAAPEQVQVAVAPPTTHQTSGFQASQSWVAQTSQRSGISPVAIAAYGDATLRIGSEQPSCHLGWSTLAGIGTIESGNGTFGGRTLLVDGTTSSPITGPALNGVGGNAAISDGNGGWSSALGPMQFIQSTWDKWGADGDGDGVADVNNIFDAALAAGRYLCADGRDLSTAQGWTAAIFSYNHDVKYVQNVYAAANAAAR